MAGANNNATDIVTTATTNRDNEEFSLLAIDTDNDNDADTVDVVLVTGFESFNRDLYEEAGRLLSPECKVNLKGMISAMCCFVMFCFIRLIYCIV